MSTRKWGWHQRKLPFHGALTFTPKIASLDQLPQEVDWAKNCPDWPSVYDQGQTGSCVGQALKRAAHTLQIAQGFPTVIEPSSMFIYYNAREAEGSCDEDAGANICDGLLGMITDGFCAESDWRLNPSFITVKPGDAQYQKATMHRVEDYKPTQIVPSDLQSLLEALSVGPVVGGVLVFESFESPDAMRTGNIPMPDESENLLGGHAIFIRGYSMPRKILIFDNSWGIDFGDEGSGTLPWEYVRRFGSDFWQPLRVS